MRSVNWKQAIVSVNNIIPYDIQFSFVWQTFFWIVFHAHVERAKVNVNANKSGSLSEISFVDKLSLENDKLSIEKYIRITKSICSSN